MWFQLTRVVCTGLVCAVAMLHVLADANEYLSTVSDFPWANAFALLGILVMVAMKELGIRSINHFKQHVTLKPPEEEWLKDAPDKDSSTSHAQIIQKKNLASNYHSGHGHTFPLVEFQHVDLVGKPLQQLTVYMMEGSIMVHSVLVGLAL